MRHNVIGSAASIGLMAALGAVMFALRSDLSDATVALVLVVPVIVAVVLGGVWAGAVAVVAGFLLYDFVFIPPYYTLTVGHARNWIALGVYVVVVSLVARVVTRLRRAQEQALARQHDSQRLLEMSELLLGDRPLDELLPLVVSIMRDAFGSEGVVLLLPRNGKLEIVASSGRELTEAELRSVTPEPGIRSALMPEQLPGATETIVLAATGRPVGLLGLVGPALPTYRRGFARAFANHIAIAVERAQLREQAVRMHVLEEVDRLRVSLVGAVSHDLRTPLATIKASASALLDPDIPLPKAEQAELLGLIDTQADRLARLVSNLLDMTRIEAGALMLQQQPLDVHELVEEAVRSLRPLVDAHRVTLDVPEDLPAVNADHVLVGEVLVNLLDNAVRFASDGSPIAIVARRVDGMVEISVSDRGPGIPVADRAAIFERGYVRRPGSEDAGRGNGAAARAGASPASAAGAGGGSGLGLAIAKAFVDAHGGTISADEAPGGGARVSFSLPAVSEPSNRAEPSIGSER
jgi:two-component system sensor histidine kinase KdpD